MLLAANVLENGWERTMSKAGKLGSGALSALCVVLAPPALAKEAGSEGAGDIVVTARRMEERLQDVPISMTVFTQQNIDNRNITTASDLATYTPSLTSNNRYGPDKTSFALRGFVQDSGTSPTVGIYFADVVALRVASLSGGGNGAGVGAMFDLQNVQVLKGPQGTLFGRNTTGGAVLLVPRKPSDRFEGYVEGSTGNYDMRRVQAVLNAPLSDTVRVRLGVDRQLRDGYLHNKSGIGPKDFNNVNYWSARTSLVADVAPDLENYFVATYQRSNTHGTLFRILQCQRDPALRTGRAAIFAAPACAQIDRQAARGDGFYDVEGSVPGQFNRTRQWQAINTTTWKASDALTIKNILSYGEYREAFKANNGGDNFSVLSGVNAGKPFPNNTVSPGPNKYSNAQRSFTEELQFQGNVLDSRLKWQIGGYFELSKPLAGGNHSYSQSLLTCTDPVTFQCAAYVSGAGLSISNYTIEYRDIGIYGQATFALSEKLSITGGLRYTSDRTRGYGQRLAVTFATPNVPVGKCANPQIKPGVLTLNASDCSSGLLAQTSSRPTWLIDLDYKPAADVLLYAKYARGYRQGGLNPTVIGLESWGPERVDSFETGAKTSFRGAISGYFNLAVFYNDFRGQQLAASAVGKPTSGLAGALVVVNAGRSRIWGIEADASVSPFEGLRFDGGYTYLNTRLQQFTLPVLGPDVPYGTIQAPTVGNDLPLSPHHRLTMSATYTLPFDTAVGKVSVGATYTYTSKQISNPADLLLYGVLPAENLLNLNLNWDSVAGKPIDLAFFVTNVTKEVFPVAVTGNWTSAGYEAFQPNAPRTYGVRVRVRFGQ